VGDIDYCHGDSVIHIWSGEELDHVTSWPVVEGCFKCLVQLQPGENIVYLRHDTDVLQVSQVKVVKEIRDLEWGRCVCVCVRARAITRTSCRSVRSRL
jgi:hypothetical protein